MNFFQRRKQKQYIKQLRHEARHARAMREDIAAPALVEKVRQAEQDLIAAGRAGQDEAIERAGEALRAASAELYPAKSYPWVRENLEIVVVALAVAMAFRTFFIQPFKIPTGSMQPTLYGITVSEQNQRGFMDYFPLYLIPLALFGERYYEVKAQVSGTVGVLKQRDEEFSVLPIDGVPHVMRNSLTQYFQPGDRVTQGQVVASGRVRFGDHIFVNKVRYNFVRPQRGNIIVFDTDNIPNIRPHSFYIKRLVGLPGETISLDPPYLVVNGEKITEPYPFERLVHDPAYHGYQLADVRAILKSENSRIQLGPREFLPFGDNTDHSLDGRYFGAVNVQALVGPAFMVYWPFSKRWGFVK